MDKQFVLHELENEFFCIGFKINRTYRLINRTYRLITVVFTYLHFPVTHCLTTVQLK